MKASLDDAESRLYENLEEQYRIQDFLWCMKESSLQRKKRVDFILAVGGGSAIDSAKAIGYGVANEGDVWDFYDRKRQATGCLPIGVVLTIAATGSEMSNSSVITKEEGWVKRIQQ
ncbi:MAG: iron-containing alcohol dehydrogenase [Coprococcus sp.]